MYCCYFFRPTVPQKVTLVVGSDDQWWLKQDFHPDKMCSTLSRFKLATPLYPRVCQQSLGRCLQLLPLYHSVSRASADFCNNFLYNSSTVLIKCINTLSLWLMRACQTSKCQGHNKICVKLSTKDFVNKLLFKSQS